MRWVKVRRYERKEAGPLAKFNKSHLQLNGPACRLASNKAYAELYFDEESGASVGIRPFDESGPDRYKIKHIEKTNSHRIYAGRLYEDYKILNKFIGKKVVPYYNKKTRMIVLPLKGDAE